MYIWTMIGELVSGSIAHPLAVTLLGPVVTASIEPNGSLPGTLTTRQPSWRLLPGPVLMA
jgi:hypothetical protein